MFWFLLHSMYNIYYFITTFLDEKNALEKFHTQPDSNTDIENST